MTHPVTVMTRCCKSFRQKDNADYHVAVHRKLAEARLDHFVGKKDTAELRKVRSHGGRHAVKIGRDVDKRIVQNRALGIAVDGQVVAV